LEKLVRFGVSMNERLIEQFDAAIGRRGYTNRSEAVRDLVRSYLVEQEWQQGDGEVAGTITLVYDHHAGPVNRELMAIQHDYHHIVVSTLHVHQDAHQCLEVIVLRGPAHMVQTVADRLISLRGVKVGRLIVASTCEPLS